MPKFFNPGGRLGSLAAAAAAATTTSTALDECLGGGEDVVGEVRVTRESNVVVVVDDFVNVRIRLGEVDFDFDFDLAGCSFGCGVCVCVCGVCCLEKKLDRFFLAAGCFVGVIIVALVLEDATIGSAAVEASWRVDDKVESLTFESALVGVDFFGVRFHFFRG